MLQSKKRGCDQNPIKNRTFGLMVSRVSGVGPTEEGEGEDEDGQSRTEVDDKKRENN